MIKKWVWKDLITQAITVLDLLGKLQNFKGISQNKTRNSFLKKTSRLPVAYDNDLAVIKKRYNRFLERKDPPFEFAH